MACGPRPQAVRGDAGQDWFNLAEIPWFNSGLFDAADCLPLEPADLELAWRAVWIGEIQWMLGHGYSPNDRPILKPLIHIECRDALLTELPSPSGRGAGGEGAHLPCLVRPGRINEGAAVRVSLVCFGKNARQNPVMLDGQPVTDIYADLTGRPLDAAGGMDLTQARPLPENAGCSFFGLCLAGAFAVDSDTARHWLRQPNPHGRPNSEVLRPIWNGVDVTQGWKGRWVIDFGADLSEAALYEAPFAWVLEKVKPVRMSNREKSRVEYWWRHGRPRPELRRRLAGLARYIATSETAKHRVFIWLPVSVAPEHKLVVIARDDDETFGILSSRFHVLWATALGGRLGVGNDPVYNSTRCFETFPFPPGLQPNRNALTPTPLPEGEGLKAAIAVAARRLNELRENWLNPPEWVDRVPEVVPGYPDRLIPKPEHAAELKKRTLTNLYNQRPAWLVNAHRTLDEAVAAAYGWPADLSDEDVLRRLLALNLERAGGGG